jgi:hypothetical protein
MRPALFAGPTERQRSRFAMSAVDPVSLAGGLPARAGGGVDRPVCCTLSENGGSETQTKDQDRREAGRADSHTQVSLGVGTEVGDALTGNGHEADGSFVIVAPFLPARGSPHRDDGAPSTSTKRRVVAQMAAADDKPHWSDRSNQNNTQPAGRRRLPRRPRRANMGSTTKKEVLGKGCQNSSRVVRVFASGRESHRPPLARPTCHHLPPGRWAPAAEAKRPTRRAQARLAGVSPDGYDWSLNPPPGIPRAERCALQSRRSPKRKGVVRNSWSAPARPGGDRGRRHRSEHTRQGDLGSRTARPESIRARLRGDRPGESQAFVFPCANSLPVTFPIDAAGGSERHTALGKCDASSSCGSSLTAQREGRVDDRVFRFDTLGEAHVGRLLSAERIKGATCRLPIA